MNSGSNVVKCNKCYQVMLRKDAVRHASRLHPGENVFMGYTDTTKGEPFLVAGGDGMSIDDAYNDKGELDKFWEDEAVKCTVCEKVMTLREFNDRPTCPHQPPPTNDPVSHPKHYCQGDIECLDAIEAAVTGLTGMDAVLTAQVIKYLWRFKRKNGVEDLKKGRFYLDRLIAREEGNGQ